VDALVVVLIAVLLTAFFFAPLGLGGGLLFVPILHYLADWPLDTATLVVSLLLTLSVSLGSGAVHHREGLIDLPSIRRLAPFAMVGAAGGAVIVHALGDALNPVFKTLALALLVWASVKVGRRLRHGVAEKDAGEVRSAPLRLGAGFGGGASAVLAIGAGAIYIPVLNQFGGLPSRRAIGTSLGLMMLVVPVAVVVHAGLHNGAWPDEGVLVLLPCAALIGAALGARVGLTLPDHVILRVFLGLLLIIAARYLWDLITLF
tara:strand:- start:582 stop:1361 length:780 start_codon:yes stop_codon:yes gene_type:complete